MLVLAVADTLNGSAPTAVAVRKEFGRARRSAHQGPGHPRVRQGELVASATQECLIRLREREHSVAG